MRPGLSNDHGRLHEKGFEPAHLRGLQCVHGDLCYDFSDVDAYLNKPETLEAFGVPAGRG